MTLVVVFVLINVLALIAIVAMARGHNQGGEDLDALARKLHPIDVRAFHNLMNEKEEDFLQENLSLREFRAVHCQRMLAAAEYVRCTAQNAGILVRLGETARLNPDPEVVAAADRLLENAVRLRLQALQTVPLLYLAIIVPGLGHSRRVFFDAYDVMTRQVVLLGLRYPTHGMASAL